MSSAILYLAIVAIWAFLLVPRWVRRSHTGFSVGPETADVQTMEEQPEPDTAPLPPIIIPGPVVAPGEPAPARAPESVSAPAADAMQPELRAMGPDRLPMGRAKVMQARRRLLTTLILLAAVAAACTVLKLTSAWVCVPPLGMLGIYLVLLREAAVADAEVAGGRAEQAHAARERARAQARQAWADRTPQPAAQASAQVIDISARLGDQLYDQYADATVRAVGD